MHYGLRDITRDLYESYTYHYDDYARQKALTGAILDIIDRNDTYELRSIGRLYDHDQVYALDVIVQEYRKSPATIGYKHFDFGKILIELLNHVVSENAKVAFLRNYIDFAVLVKNLPEYFKIEIVEQRPGLLSGFGKPTERMILAAFNSDPGSILRIDDWQNCITTAMLEKNKDRLLTNLISEASPILDSFRIYSMSQYSNGWSASGRVTVDSFTKQIIMLRQHGIKWPEMIMLHKLVSTHYYESLSKIE